MGHFVRLACLRHAASVHPEPGSNSPKKFILFLFFLLVFLTSGINVLLSFQRSFRFLVESTTNISFAFFIVNTFFKFTKKIVETD